MARRLFSSVPQTDLWSKASAFASNQAANVRFLTTIGALIGAIYTVNSHFDGKHTDLEKKMTETNSRLDQTFTNWQTLIKQSDDRWAALSEKWLELAQKQHKLETQMEPK